MRTSVVRLGFSLTLVAVLAGGCADSTSPAARTPAAAPPAVGAVTVAPNALNALAAFVTFTVRGADSARVLYRAGTGAEQATAVVAVRDSAQIPLLGLPAGVAVTARVVAVGRGGTDTSAAVTGPVAAVPDVVRRVRLNITAGHATPGYVLTSVVLGDTLYAVAFDTVGTVAWYRAFPGAAAGGDAYPQPNGNITVFQGASHSWEPVPGIFTEVRASGAEVRQWSAPAGYYNDLHELLVGAGSRPTYLLGYDFKPMDFRSRGGSADSSVSGHTIFALDASGAAKPVFVARDHFTIADWINPEAIIQDFDHPNSIDVDTDGGLIVSWRNFDEVSKIDPAKGQFVWRLGGRHNQFTFVNDPLNGFSGQHFARVLPGGNLLLYDNGTTHRPQESRAAEYRLDAVAHTATLVWEYRHQPAIYTPFVGSAQRLANGNTFVGYGGAGVATEVTPSGAVTWEGTLTVDGATASAYRLLKIAALGAYAAP